MHPPLPLDELYLTIINSLHDGIYLVDLDRRILFWNKAAEEITGYGAQEMVGTRCPDNQLKHIDEGGRPLCIVGCPLTATNLDGQVRRARVFLRHKQGYRIPVMIHVLPLLQEGRIIGSIEIFTRDSSIVYEDSLVEHLSGMAMHDALTGLPNRRYLEDFLYRSLREFSRFPRPIAVLFADIDNFREFNNRYSHDVGDAVLKKVAANAKKSARAHDLLGRWGGEEFLGIYFLNDCCEAPALAERFRCLVQSTELPHEGEQLRVTISVGVTITRAGDTVEGVVKRADELMYASKRNGKNCISAD